MIDEQRVEEFVKIKMSEQEARLWVALEVVMGFPVGLRSFCEFAAQFDNRDVESITIGELMAGLCKRQTI